MDFIGNIIGSLFDAVFGFLGDILMFIIEWLVKLIVAPLVKGLIDTIRVLLSNTFYTLSIFLLRLVDFVEMLFRALAGLPNNRTDGANITLTLGEGGGGGDLLLQLLKSGGVQQAFLSMCVVGIFLLVVTTVFQIIKNEYTTEGSKNAKGPIFQKAFKGLANLLLLPLLVVFGIIFANQLLNLLDIATKANAGSTISGQLFVTAATEAQYNVLGTAEDDRWVFEKDSYIYRETMGLCLSLEAFVEGIGSAYTEIFNPNNAPDESGVADEGINKQFSTQQLKYYKISEVSQYYDFSRINYLLLILGACIILKVLFFTCFGLVLRLYKCAILFIISPAIIGMTPINEGGLGKWRTSFIGQVLAAYGTVLSINLFFIVVSVLLSVEVSFTGFGGGFDVLSSSLMTSLLKCIFVIAGCILIEKFTKELGGYFGADDAASAGKDLAKQVGDTAQKSGKVAVAAGRGAYKLNRGIAKAGVGIAKGVGKTVAGGVDLASYLKNGGRKGHDGKGFLTFNKERQKKRKDAVSGFAKKVGNGALSAIKMDSDSRKWRKIDRFYSGNGSSKDARAAYSHFQEEKALADKKKSELTSKLDNAKYADYLERDKKGGKFTDAEMKEFMDLDDRAKQGQVKAEAGDIGQLKKDLTRQETLSSANQKSMDQFEKDYGEHFVENYDADKAKAAERRANAKAWFGGKVMNAASFFEGVAMEGMDLMPGTKFFGNMQKMQDKGADALGDGFIAANKDAKEGPKSRKKRREDAAEEDFAWALDAQRRAGGIKVSNQMVENLKVKQLQDQNDINRSLNTLNSAFHASEGDLERQKELALQAAQYAQQKGSDMSFDEIMRLFEQNRGKKIDLNLSQLKLDFDVKALQKDIQDSIAKGMASTTEGLTQAISKAVQKQMDGKNNPQLVNMVISAVKQAIQEAQ